MTKDACACWVWLHRIVSTSRSRVDSDHLEKDWSLPALGAMIDPAREEVKPALMKAMARAFARS